MSSVEETVSIEVDGIPVVFNKRNYGRRSTLRLLGRIQNDEKNADGSPKVTVIDKINDAFEVGDKVFGEEQMENICNQLDPDGDPDGGDFVKFLFAAIGEAFGGDSKN